MNAPRAHSYWRIVWRQFRRNPLAVLGLLLVLFMASVALAAPFLAGNIPIYLHKDGKSYWLPNIFTYSELQAENLYANFDRWQPGPEDRVLRPPVPYGPLQQDLRAANRPPSREHWLGTDDRGRDVLSRMIWGARIAMSVGLVAVGIAALIGICLGALAGYYGGWVDAVVLRIIEMVLVVPTFFLILAVMAILKPSIFLIMAVIGMTGWTDIARLVRGEFMKQKELDYVTAARATGLRDLRIIFRHVLPNALNPVFVSAAFGVAGAVLVESALSFLGFGAPPPTPSWGETLKQAQGYVNERWWLVAFPGMAIFTTVVAFNLVGEGLRDALDPKLRE